MHFGVGADRAVAANILNDGILPNGVTSAATLAVLPPSGPARSSDDTIRSMNLAVDPTDATWERVRALAAHLRAAPINNPGSAFLRGRSGPAVAKTPPPFIRQSLHEYLDENESKGKGKGKRNPWEHVRRRRDENCFL